MASSAANIYAAQPAATGALRAAPLTTTAPTGATTVLPAAWVDLGYIGESGFAESHQRDKTKKKAFGGATVKILQTEFGITYKFKFMESLNADVLKEVYGEENVTVTPATASKGTQITVKKNKKVNKHKSYCIDTVDGAATRRNYIADGQLSMAGDTVLVHTDTIEYEVEIETFESATGDNVLEFIDDGITTSA
ncbi:hypothetical protein [Rhodococcus globerulus]|uniref:phage tail tube protein n=1 Tax=Rhodococcus globerulus TaxID=33008 RepID=UPI001C5880CC|nr:hypothetical protein [Rhodococcus globerulus]QXW04008.1 hypothetical protein KYT97_08310 [Rhodococcus globerulus]